MRGRGRPKAKNVNLDVEILDEARSACNHISIDQLAHDCDISRKTIERARKQKRINPEFLDRIGKRLNVDPHWLTGDDLKIPFIKRNRLYCKLSNHPYHEMMRLQKNIDFTRHFNELLILHVVTREQFDELSDGLRFGFELELDLVIQLLMFKYFSDSADPATNPFLSNREIAKMAQQVLSGDTYNKLLELLEL